ncbi:MAG: hypothetical protein KF757_07010 [Phycisphaeraceae bacterium]|nr:hypothetical protein [Phycisphaeraceae bacterium]MCW5763342.1 hypothetical protein [Phycisphaeraceae bacterium]
MPPTPQFIRVLVALASAVMTLTALAGLGVALFAIGTPIWGGLSFELVLLLAGIVGLISSTGRFDRGFGIAAASIGGCILGASVLGSLDFSTNLATTSLGKFVLPVVLIRVVLGVLIAGLGALAVLLRRPAEFKRIALGLAFGLPVFMLGVAFWFRKLGFLLDTREGGAEIVRMSALFVIGIISIALLSVSGHLLITAFERTKTQADAAKR